MRPEFLRSLRPVGGTQSQRLLGRSAVSSNWRFPFCVNDWVLRFTDSRERELPKLPAERNRALGTTTRGQERLQAPITAAFVAFRPVISTFWGNA